MKIMYLVEREDYILLCSHIELKNMTATLTNVREVREWDGNFTSAIKLNASLEKVVIFCPTSINFVRVSRGPNGETILDGLSRLKDAFPKPPNLGKSDD